MAKEEQARMEGEIEGFKTVIDTVKADIENLKSFVSQVGTLATRCDKIKERVTRLEGSKNGLMDEVKE